MKKLSPQEGGCWYCYRDNMPLRFSFEFDTYIHEQCIKNVRDKNKELKKYDPENEIFLKEFGIND